jgi:hypothetical protein
MNKPVLIDSSIWVDYFNKARTTTTSKVQTLIRKNQAVINPIIRLEILTGAKSKKQFNNLSDFLLGLTSLKIDKKVYGQAEQLRFEMRKAGFTIPIPDVLIASTAITFDCPLLNCDEHFDVIARYYHELKNITQTNL